MDPVRPDYAQGGVAGLVSPLLGGRAPEWFPPGAEGADTIVLLVVDGLGWNALGAHRGELPALAGLEGRPITTVVPSTTATALTSITTGLPPAEHGMVGYRMYLSSGVLNALRWSMSPKHRPPDAEEIQPRLAFGGQPVPVVTEAGFKDSGFTAAHLRGGRFVGSHSPSGVVEHCRRLTRAGERLVYAYYESVDVVGHMHGLDDGFFAAELRYVDRLVGDLLDALSSETALVVTADHGHVQFSEAVELGPPEELVEAQAGDGRFRYLHARPGAAAELLEASTETHGARAWVFSREQLIDEGWLGPRPPSPSVRRRIGDVVLAAREPIFFADPKNPGERKLRSGHGSLTPDEMLVPLLVGRGRGA